MYYIWYIYIGWDFRLQLSGFELWKKPKSNHLKSKQEKNLYFQSVNWPEAALGQNPIIKSVDWPEACIWTKYHNNSCTAVIPTIGVQHNAEDNIEQKLNPEMNANLTNMRKTIWINQRIFIDVTFLKICWGVIRPLLLIRQVYCFCLPKPIIW